MEKPWVYAVAAVCGLFVVVMGIRHFRSSEPDQPRTPYTRVASLPERATNDSSGWTARVGGTTSAGTLGGEAVARGSGREQHGAAGGSRSSATGSGGNRGLASAFTDRGATGRGSFGATSSLPKGSTSAPSGAIHADAGVSAAGVPFEGGKSLTDIREAHLSNPNLGGTQGGGGTAQGTDTTADANDVPADGGPVLSLPFEGSTEPDRGDAAVFEQGVTFDSGEGAVFSTDSQFVVPNGGNISGDAGTVSFWMQPQWEGGDESNASLVQLRNQNVWENRLQVFKNGRYLRFLLTDSSGLEHNIGATIDSWQPGEWHQVTATWGEALQSFYVDGKLVGQVTVDGQLNVQPGTPLYIGSDLKGGVPGANGAISQFQVYNRPLAPNEVNNLVLGGAPRS